jgi:hypothetical protein
MVHLLRGYCNKHPKLWDEHLHYIQHAYNRSKHSSTQTSPFEACFGYLPKSPLDFIFGKDIAIDGQYDINREKSSLNKFSRYIKWYKSSWKRVKPSTRQDMTSIVLITVSKLEIKFFFTLVRRGLKEKVKN